jgi:flagellar hook-associated protein 3 FlgL
MTDDVIAAKGIIKANKQLANMDQFVKNMGLASTELKYVDSTLGSAVTQITKANDVAIQAANGTENKEGRAALLDEVEAIIGNMKSYANTQFNDVNVFSGTKTTSPTYVEDALTGSLVYNGDNGARQIEIDDGMTQQINFTGDEIFGQAIYIEDPANPGQYIMDEDASSGVFKALYQLRDALKADDFNQDDARATLDGFSEGLRNVTDTRTSSGLLVNKFDDLTEAYDTSSLQITELKSSLEDLDLTSAISDWYASSQAMQASYSMMSQSMSVSLLDYL